ncbi:UNKNOWN [Stylonychia lemnae]|uniref:Uncharacterized protein n=1 Tax=Stylonychia lemnae TaxID=5949 RepID=A0A077ZPF7_STYLE|nr:UNKNOWN [Stylonychia lemnae]|eukprot:CDW71847.1 UNKNOWN [Stylonychia lemnae]
MKLRAVANQSKPIKLAPNQNISQIEETITKVEQEIKTEQSKEVIKNTEVRETLEAYQTTSEQFLPDIYLKFGQSKNSLIQSRPLKPYNRNEIQSDTNLVLSNFRFQDLMLNEIDEDLSCQSLQRGQLKRKKKLAIPEKILRINTEQYKF